MKRLLSPRVTVPVIVLLAGLLVAAGAAYAMKDGGGTELVIESCNTADDPNCNLRQGVHWHSDFALYVRGEQFDFNQPQFVSVEGSGEDHHPFLHIHPERYTVVHVHLSGSTWSEFFATLGFELKDPTLAGIEESTTCLTMPGGEKLCNNETEKLRFFRNGVEVDGIGLSDITDMDRVLITYGSENDEEIAATRPSALWRTTLRPGDSVAGSRPKTAKTPRRIRSWFCVSSRYLVHSSRRSLFTATSTAAV